jgi:hypothetical protein
MTGTYTGRGPMDQQSQQHAQPAEAGDDGEDLDGG